MRLLGSVAAWLALALLPVGAGAQKTEGEIQARLVGKALYLRGQWSGDKLEFDAAGKLKGSSPATSFTLAGVDVKSVKLTAKELVLGGHRMGIEFNKDVPKRVKQEKISLRIPVPADGDLQAALDGIFTDNLADLDPPLPACWQTFAREHLLAGSEAPGRGRVESPSAGAGDAPMANGVPVRKTGGGVTPPKVLTVVEPEYSEAARAMKYSGVVTVSMVVGVDGRPENVRVLHPVGLGLDEQAVAAVSKYTFRPAMEGGNPVPVQISAEANFQIYGSGR